MKKKWLIKDAPDLRLVEQLKKELHVSEIVAYLLVQRGITTRDAAVSFFRGSLKELHDPFLMKGIKEAVNCINKQLQKDTRILVYGDYDVDGTTAVSVVYSYLFTHTSSISYYIPDRYKEGYGVSMAGIQHAIDNDVKLIITLDCGIRAVTAIKKAREAGIEVIVCDHHLPGQELPDAIVCDPKQEGCEYPFKELSGCGVGFKLMNALQIQNKWEEAPLFEYIDLVAISIGADIVPVIGENRLLSQFGLKNINKNTRIGIQALLKLAKKEKPLSLTDVVFTIAPRINAAGRIDDAKEAVRLMVSKDEEKVKEIADKIHQYNEERRGLDKAITAEALEQLEKDPTHKNQNSTVVYNKEWHKGVIGIVASRLIEQHYRPTIVFTQSESGNWTGSVRSIEGVNAYEILDRCSEYINQFGGHYFAAGLTVSDENLLQFKNRFEEEVTKVIKEETLIPEQIIEREIDFNEIFTQAESVAESPHLLRMLKQFEPHGPMNLHPRFLARNVYAEKPTLLKGEHLKMKVYQPEFKKFIDAIYFSAPEAYDIVRSGSFDMVFSLDENQFRGRTTPQLMIKDIRPSIIH